jgi:hypothetical protein
MDQAHENNTNLSNDDWVKIIHIMKDAMLDEMLKFITRWQHMCLLSDMLEDRRASNNATNEQILSGLSVIDPFLAWLWYGSDDIPNTGVYIIVEMRDMDLGSFRRNRGVYDYIAYLSRVYKDPIYKIGKAENVRRRLDQLQTGNPGNLKVMHVIETDDISWLEGFLHNSLSRKRCNGEWFRLDKKELDLILGIKSLNRPRRVEDQVNLISLKTDFEKAEMERPL